MANQQTTITLRAGDINKDAQRVVDILDAERKKRLNKKIDEIISIKRTTRGFFGFFKKDLPPCTRDEAVELLKVRDDWFKSTFDEIMAWNGTLYEFARLATFVQDDDNATITVPFDIYATFRSWADSNEEVG